jgi:hypothetical protein
MAKNTFAVLGILAVLLMGLGLVSAASLSISNVVIPSNVNREAGSFAITFNLSNSGLETDIDWSNSVSTSGTISSFSFSESYINASESKIITATVNFPGSQTGNIAGLINAGVVNGSGDDKNFTFSVPINFDEDPHNFCGSNFNTSEIEIKYIRDKSSSDDWEWKPLDEIEIEVKVENNGDSDEDYDIELIFLDGSNNDVSDEVVEDEDDLIEEDFEVEEDKNEEVTFNFVVNGEVDDDDYKLFAIVTRSGQCNFLRAEDFGDEIDVDVKKSSHDVIVKEVEGPTTVEAGSTMDFEVRVANLGRSDEDRVKVIAFNSELGINIQKEIDDLDEGDSERLTFNIPFPSTVDEKLYRIRFSTEFKYDEDDEVYEDESESADDLLKGVTIFGGENEAPSISASLLSSEPKVGEEITIQVSITNNGADGSYVVSAVGYESWADLVSVQPQVLDLDDGETKQVTVKLNPTKEGSQAFSVRTLSGGEESSQSVSMNIAGKENIFGSWGLEGNALTYIIAAIAAVLILIVLILIVRVSKSSNRTTVEEF